MSTKLAGLFENGFCCIFQKGKSNLDKLSKISLKRPLQLDEVCKAANLEISTLGVINEFTSVEEGLISLLQRSLKELVTPEHKLIIVEDVNKIPKVIYENFFVMSKDSLKKGVSTHGQTIEELDYDDVLLVLYIRNCTARLGNERYDKTK